MKGDNGGRVYLLVRLRYDVYYLIDAEPKHIPRVVCIALGKCHDRAARGSQRLQERRISRR
jgi:hypothetical protein